MQVWAKRMDNIVRSSTVITPFEWTPMAAICMCTYEEIIFSQLGSSLLQIILIRSPKTPTNEERQRERRGETRRTNLT